MDIKYGNVSKIWNKDSLKKYGEQIGFSTYGDMVYRVEKSNGEILYFAVDADDKVYSVKVAGV